MPTPVALYNVIPAAFLAALVSGRDWEVSRFPQHRLGNTFCTTAAYITGIDFSLLRVLSYSKPAMHFKVIIEWHPR